MYKNALYVSVDLTVYPDKVVYHLPIEPHANRLNRVLSLCNLKVEGEPYVKNNHWVQPVSEVKV